MPDIIDPEESAKVLRAARAHKDALWGNKVATAEVTPGMVEEFEAPPAPVPESRPSLAVVKRRGKKALRRPGPVVEQDDYVPKPMTGMRRNPAPQQEFLCVPNFRSRLWK